MASILEILQVKYKGLQVEVSADEKKTIITYQGSFDLCNDALQEIYRINTSDPSYGNIENVRMFCAEGPFWNLEVTYSIDKSGSGAGSSNGSTYGPKSSELSMSMLSMPLEKLPNYRMNWNNNLYTTFSGNVTTPALWERATYEDDYIKGTAYEYPGTNIESGQVLSTTYFQWAKNKSELDVLPYGCIWHIVKKMTKPGVENYGKPVYTLTEKAKHTSKSKAGWVLASVAGTIGQPTAGDFDIQKRLGGDWLCEGGTVNYDGHYWVAELQYTHSPSLSGWDKDLYPYLSAYLKELKEKGNKKS